MPPIRFLTPALASVATLAAPPAQAQFVDLGQVTVLATRVATEVQRSGTSVSIVDRSEIEASGATQLSDLLARLPGVSVVRSGGPGTQTGLRIRGASPGYVAVYVDGIRIDDPTGTSVQTDFGHVTLDDIGRIEVLRGTQSALYGGSAVGGVVSITTRRPERDGFSQEAAAEVGSFRSSAARYSLAFRDDRMEASVTLAHRRTDGFTAWEGIPGTPGFSPNAESDGFEANRLSTSFRYRASDTVSFGITGFTQRSRNEYDTSDPVTFQMDPDSDAVTRWRQSGLRFFAELDTGAVRHEVSATGYRIDRELFTDGAFTNSFTGRRTLLAYQGDFEVAPGLTLVWGADTMEERSSADTLPPAGESTRTTGAFAQLLWAPMDALDLGATARLDRNSAFGTFQTGRLTAAWQVTPQTTLRAAVARGFRPPSLDERFGDYGFFVGNPGLEPETSTSAEIGLDHRFSGGGRANATLFWLDTDNLITYDGSVSPNTLNNLSGKSRRRGLELTGSLPFNAQFTLTASYTYTDARAASGGRLARVPRHDLALGVDAELAARLRGAVDLRHLAGRPNESDFSVFPAASVAMPSYTVVNANLRYAVTDHADLYLRVENLFDRQYQEVLGYATPGRSVHVGVAARF